MTLNILRLVQTQRNVYDKKLIKNRRLILRRSPDAKETEGNPKLLQEPAVQLFINYETSMYS